MLTCVMACNVDKFPAGGEIPDGDGENMLFFPLEVSLETLSLLDFQVAAVAPFFQAIVGRRSASVSSDEDRDTIICIFVTIRLHYCHALYLLPLKSIQKFQ